MWSSEKLVVYGPCLGWYAINILPEGVLLGRDLNMPGSAADASFHLLNKAEERF